MVVAGRIQTGSYTNKEGQKIYTTDVVIEEQEFAESKNTANTVTSNNTTNDGFMQMPEDFDNEGLPF